MATYFNFPQLGATGEGEPPYPGSRERIWAFGEYGVTHQGDRPACAYRCHFPGGSSPCDLETAMRFVAYIARGGWRTDMDLNRRTNAQTGEVSYVR
jgi:hypothetical protein